MAFRSEPMQYIKMYLPAEMAQYAIAELAELECLQLKDVRLRCRRSIHRDGQLNVHVPSFQRAYTRELRRCDDLERIHRE